VLDALCGERHFTADWLAEARQADLPLLRQLVSDGHLLPQR
jgi:hypothetical protein